MKIIVDGRRVGKGNEACYNECIAYFKKMGLNKRNVLHEFYHHLVHVFDWNLTQNKEERKANWYSKVIMENVI